MQDLQDFADVNFTAKTDKREIIILLFRNTTNQYDAMNQTTLQTCPY